MNAASQWRYALAQKIAPFYSQNPKVQVVEVGGSVSRGCADDYSDVELGIYWSEPPTQEERSGVIEQLGGVPWHFFDYDPEERVWGEDYFVQGVKLDVGHWTVATMEDLLSEVLEKHDSALVKQQHCSAIQHALPLYGGEQVHSWQRKIKQYPHELAVKMVREYLSFNPCWAGEMQAERDDVLVLSENFCAVERKILLVLMGINRIYYPGFKWMDRLIGEMTVAPPDLSRRLKQIFRVEPVQGLQQLKVLIEEVFALVEEHMPEVEMADARTYFGYRRTKWAQAPKE